ncbi:MAG: DUF59 domain-containing protein [Desulfurococcales archaeon]|nr:DUF59 domain-containing protein [Desulfurococcales archaeon]
MGVEAVELRQRIIEALKKVYDPEIPVSVWDLGLIYELKINEEGFVYIKMTLTSPGCPVAGQIITGVIEAVSSVQGVRDVDAELVFDPPWSPDMVTPEGREELKKIYGYDVVEEYLRKEGKTHAGEGA